MASDSPAEIDPWNIRPGGLEDIEAAIEALAADMDVERREKFRDKLERYARKPDRQLYLAYQGAEVIGFGTVIERGEPAPQIPRALYPHLAKLACCTGLMVVPRCRRRGIGAALHRHLEQWVRERQLPGYWLVTHRMAAWYQQHFGCVELARLPLGHTSKVLMAKEFSLL